MVAVTAYALTGMAAMLVIAFWLAYGDGFPQVKTPRFRETVGKQEKAVPAAWLQKTLPVKQSPAPLTAIASKTIARQ